MNKTIKIIIILFLALAFAAALLYMDLMRIRIDQESNEIQEETDPITVRSMPDLDEKTKEETVFEFEPVEEDIETLEEDDEIPEMQIETEPETEAIEYVPETETEPVVEYVETPTIEYTDDDLMLLARIVQNEAGADFASDEHQRAVASVLVNRVADGRFPNAMYACITQGWRKECPLQYAIGGNSDYLTYEDREAIFFSIVPSERAIQNAAYVMANGSTVADAVWQAEFVQGEVVAVFSYDCWAAVTYICK